MKSNKVLVGFVILFFCTTLFFAILCLVIEIKLLSAKATAKAEIKKIKKENQAREEKLIYQLSQIDNFYQKQIDELLGRMTNTLNISGLARPKVSLVEMRENKAKVGAKIINIDVYGKWIAVIVPRENNYFLDGDSFLVFTNKGKFSAHWKGSYAHQNEGIYLAIDDCHPKINVGEKIELQLVDY